MRRLLAVLITSVALAGCGGGSDSSLNADSGPSDVPVTQGPIRRIGPVAGGATSCVSAPPTATGVDGTTDVKKKPQIEVPDAPPPCDLVVGDIVEGSGRAAKAGDPLTMKYVGVLYSTGKQFDASWDRGQDFPFVLGAGNVIQGWDQGLVGMKAGGRRQLVIPPALGYGDQAQGADIPAGSTLIFVVDLVKIG